MINEKGYKLFFVVVTYMVIKILKKDICRLRKNIYKSIMEGGRIYEVNQEIRNNY